MHTNRQFFLLILFCVLASTIKAQKGTKAFSVNCETTIPIFQSDRGFGFFLKGLIGIGKTGQLTLSGGLSRFNSKSSIEPGTTTRLIPFLFGYKQNVQKFFVEPKIGLGELGGKILVNGDYSRPSIAAVFGGLAGGYTINRFNIGINFLNARGIENRSAGTWHNKSFYYTSVYLGYDLFSKITR